MKYRIYNCISECEVEVVNNIITNSVKPNGFILKWMIGENFEWIKNYYNVNNIKHKYEIQNLISHKIEMTL